MAKKVTTKAASKVKSKGPSAAMLIRSRPPVFTKFGRSFNERGTVVQPDEFTSEQWSELESSQHLVVTKAD